jgi:hypothetical protein
LALRLSSFSNFLSSFRHRIDLGTVFLLGLTHLEMQETAAAAAGRIKMSCSVIPIALFKRHTQNIPSRHLSGVENDGD